MGESKGASSSSNSLKILMRKVTSNINIDHYCEYQPQNDWETYLNYTPKEMT